MGRCFLKRSICTLLNGVSWNRLNDNFSEWLILDNYYFTHKLYLISGCGGSQKILQFPGEVKKEIFRIITTNPKYAGYTIEELDAVPNYPLLIKNIIAKLQRWNGKIIILDAVRANHLIDHDGSIINIDKNESYLRHYSTKMIMDSLDCFYISVPDNIYANYYKSCDKNPVHYGKEVYEYYSKAISAIINNKPNQLNELQKNYLDLQTQESSIIEQYVISESYLSGRIMNYINNKKSKDDLDCVLRLCNELMRDNEQLANHLLALLYYMGRGANKNLQLAYHYSQTSVDHGYVPSFSLQFDILWDMGNKESDITMVQLIKQLAESGNSDCQYRMGRAYHYGRGVKKDLIIASEWLRLATNSKHLQSLIELSDVLWEIGTPKSYAEMIDLVKPLAIKENGDCLIRLGKAYRYGKGVEKDLSKARYLTRKAVNKKTRRASLILFDILWEINDDDSDKEMLDLIKPMATKGNSDGQLRLARAYRFGRGVSKDLNEAAYWMKRAYDSGNKFAPAELFDILWEINTPESNEYMINLGNKYVDLKNRGFLFRMGRAYLEGHGVPINQKLGEQYIVQAANKGLKDAQLLLDQMQN